MSLYHLHLWEPLVIFPWEFCKHCLTHKCFFCCLLSCSYPSKTGDKSYSIKARILYVCFPEIREQDITSPGHLSLPTASSGILKEGELCIVNCLRFLIHSERQWHDHLIVWAAIDIKETQGSYFIVIMSTSSLSKTGQLLIQPFHSKAETSTVSLIGHTTHLKTFSAIIIRGV